MRGEPRGSVDRCAPGPSDQRTGAVPRQPEVPLPSPACVCVSVCLCVCVSVCLCGGGMNLSAEGISPTHQLARGRAVGEVSPMTYLGGVQSRCRS